MADDTHDVTLVEFIRMLLGLGPDKDENIQLRDWFAEDPAAALEHYGLGHLTEEDVRDAIVIAQDNDTVSFDRSYDTGFDRDAGHGDWAWKAAGAHQEGGEHVRTHVTENQYRYDIDDRDTILDQSVNQKIDTGGGDFEQSIENNSVNATGDGAVAAGGDIEAPVTTGDGNVVGDGNKVVSGDGNVVAFGQGSAVSDVSVDDGGAFSVNGPANGNSSVNDSYNDVDTTTETTTSYEYDDSFNQTTENSVTTDVDTHNHVSVGSDNTLDVG